MTRWPKALLKAGGDFTVAGHIFVRTGIRPKTVLVDAPGWERAAMLESMREVLKAEAKARQKRG